MSGRYKFAKPWATEPSLPARLRLAEQRIAELEAQVARLQRYIRADESFVKNDDYTAADTREYYDALAECEKHGDFEP